MLARRARGDAEDRGDLRAELALRDPRPISGAERNLHEPKVRLSQENRKKYVFLRMDGTQACKL